MTPFQFCTPPRIVAAPDALNDISDRAATLLGPRCLIVTDPGVRGLGLTEPAEADLRRAGIDVIVFDQVETDPSLGTVQAAVALGNAKHITGVLGIGGGSSLDVAKLTALLVGSAEDLDGAWGVDNAQGPRLPLVLVPTTAGTGSEVTPVAIVTVSDDEKRGVSSPLLIPDIAILDPTLTYGLPAQHTAATGIDAMVHAVEAYTSINPNNNPISRMLALHALHLAGTWIQKAVHEPGDTDARSNMLLASMFAGQAFANSPVAAVHALAYPLGSQFHIPHGLSNALVLPHVLRFNEAKCSSAYAELAAAAFPSRKEGSDLASLFEDLIERLEMPSRLRAVGVSQGAVADLARAAMTQTRLLVNNPRMMTHKDAEQIYHAAW